MSDKRAVVLLSGGLDSSTTLAIARRLGYRCCALTLDYGQRNIRELDSARAMAAAIGVDEHMVFAVNLRRFGGSALTDDIAVPPARGALPGIPMTYVPARNTVMLSLALAYAESRGIRDIYIGVNHIDFAGYPDCRPDFIAAFEILANLATRAGVEGAGAGQIRIHAPLQNLDKGQIVQQAVQLGIDFGLTWSCYDPQPDGAPCRRCDSCANRRQGFDAAGVSDPLSPTA